MTSVPAKTGKHASAGALAGTPPDTLFFFYFSGAGVSRSGTNYIMCDDTDTSIPESAWRTMISVNDIRAWSRANAAISVLILDTNFVDLDA